MIPTTAPGNAAVLDMNGQMSQAWRQYINRLGTGGFQVGDYLQTARSDIGGPWLLCDGSVVAQADYPALFAVLKGLIAEGPNATFFLPLINAVYGADHPAPDGPPIMQTWIKAL